MTETPKTEPTLTEKVKVIRENMQERLRSVKLPKVDRTSPK